MESDFFHKIHAYTTRPCPKSKTKANDDEPFQSKPTQGADQGVFRPHSFLGTPRGAHPWAEEAPVSSLLDRMAEGGRWWVGDWSEEKQELSGLRCSKKQSPESCPFFFPSFLCSKRPEVPSLPKPPRSKPGLPTDQTQQWSVNCWACTILQYWWRTENQECLLVIRWKWEELARGWGNAINRGGQGTGLRGRSSSRPSDGKIGVFPAPLLAASPNFTGSGCSGHQVFTKVGEAFEFLLVDLLHNRFVHECEYWLFRVKSWSKLLKISFGFLWGDKRKHWF